MLGYTMLPGRGDTDLLLAQVVDTLLARRLRVCACVQFNPERPGQHRCDMMIRTVPAERIYKISQDLGAGARGCRLDVNALEAAALDVTKAFEGGADVLIINKFGKHEAQGRGFRELIGEAVARGVPVLVGLNELNKTAFLDFSAGIEQQIGPSLSELVDWVANHTTATATG